MSTRINCVRKIAAKQGRDYITPEDVSDALAQGCDANKVRLAVLEVIGKKLGAEDASLCAFVAHRGTPTS